MSKLGSHSHGVARHHGGGAKHGSGCAGTSATAVARGACRRRRRGGSLLAACVALGLVLAASAGRAAADAEPIDLNSASAADLASLPGIGPAKAQAILAYREATPFRTTEDLLQVKGIGERLYAQLKDRIRVGSAAAPHAAAGGAHARSAPPSSASSGPAPEAVSGEAGAHRSSGAAAH